MFWCPNSIQLFNVDTSRRLFCNKSSNMHAKTTCHFLKNKNDPTVSSADQRSKYPQKKKKKRKKMHCTSGSAQFRKEYIKNSSTRLSSTDAMGFSVATPSAGREPPLPSSRRLGQLNADTFRFLVTFTNNEDNLKKKKKKFWFK